LHAEANPEREEKEARKGDYRVGGLPQTTEAAAHQGKFSSGELLRARGRYAAIVPTPADGRRTALG